MVWIPKIDGFDISEKRSLTVSITIQTQVTLWLFNIYPKVFGYHEWFHISSVIAGVIALDLHNELIDGLL